MKLLTVLFAFTLLAGLVVAAEVTTGASASGTVSCSPDTACQADCDKNAQPLCADFAAYQECLVFYGQDKVAVPSWIYTRRCALGVQCRLSASVAADYIRALV